VIATSSLATFEYFAIALAHTLSDGQTSVGVVPFELKPFLNASFNNTNTNNSNGHSTHNNDNLANISLISTLSTSQVQRYSEKKPRRHGGRFRMSLSPVRGDGKRKEESTPMASNGIRFTALESTQLLPTGADNTRDEEEALTPMVPRYGGAGDDGERDADHSILGTQRGPK
jgi:hypothetical protein